MIPNKKILQVATLGGSGLLLCGPRGLYQLDVSRLAARKILCTGDKSEQCRCESCRTALEQHPDYLEIRATKGSGTIGRPDITRIMEQKDLCPFTGERRVFVVDGLEKITKEAANSLLKFIEEGERNSAFIGIAYAGPERVLPTLVSRLQLFRFQPFTKKEFFGASELQGYSQDDAELLYGITGGCPQLVLEIPKGALEQMKVARQAFFAGDQLEFFKGLHMINEREKKSLNFFTKYKPHALCLLKCLHRCLSQQMVQAVKEDNKENAAAIASQVELLKDEYAAILRPGYSRDDFYSFLIALWALR